MNEEMKNYEVEEEIEVNEDVEVIDLEPTSTGNGKKLVTRGLIVTGLALAAGAVWKNRKKIKTAMDERKASKLRKKGYTVTKIYPNMIDDEPIDDFVEEEAVQGETEE